VFNILMAKDIFVCGLARGGTTMSMLAIGAHPDAHPMGETMYLAKTDPSDRECSCGTVGCHHNTELFEAIAPIPEAHATYDAKGALSVLREPNIIPGPNTIRSEPPESAEELEELISAGVLGLDAIARVFAARYGTDLTFVDNSKEVRFAERLNTDRWQVVVVTRDLRGVANSMLKGAERVGVPRTVEEKFPIWQDFSERAASLIASGSGVHVRYEDLCRNPIENLNRVAEGAGLSPYKTEMLQDYETHMLFGVRKARRWAEEGIGQPDNSWEVELPIGAQEQITTSFSHFYQAFGYNT
jgi:hypothetical protein